MTPKCLACGSDRALPWSRGIDYEYFSVDQEFDYLKCTSCSSLFIDPVPDDRLVIIYPENYYSFIERKASLGEKIKFIFDARLFRSVSRQIKGSVLNVLDIGGGNGWMLDLTKKADSRVSRTVEVDLDEKAGRVALDSGHEFWHGRIEDFRPKSEEKFELVLALNLIEHLKDPGAVLKKISELLSPGGRVIVKTPNIQSLDARMFRNSYWGGLHCPRHWVLFTSDSFIDLARRNGLEVDRISFTQGAPFWAYSIMACLHRKGLVKFSKKSLMFDHFLFKPLTLFFAMLDVVRGSFFKTSQMFVILRLR